MKDRRYVKLLAAGLAALSLGLAGCLTDSEDEPPTITVQPTGQASYAYGDTVTLSITATGSGTLTFTWLADNDTIDGDVITTVGGTSTLKAVPPASSNGAQLKVIVSNGEGSVTSNALTLNLTGLTPWPSTDKNVTLGAQGASAGSALELDTAGVWNSVTANSNQAKIDLVLLFHPKTGGSLKLFGARAARDAGVADTINLTNGYDTNLVKDIKFVQVSAKPASQQAAKELYVEAQEDDDLLRSVAVAVGLKLVVKTTENRYVYLEVTGITGGTANTGTAALTLSIGAISP